MSSHCNKYPGCGCGSFGTKCDLPEAALKEIQRNSNGFPLLPNGEIDWGLTSDEKQAYLDRYEESMGEGKKYRKRGTNFTPPKKKRKKRS